MKLIVGLGNPGSTYAGTRHNIGFAFIDAFIESEGLSWRSHWRGKYDWVKIPGFGDRVLAIKPLTYMNRSGDVTAEIARKEGVDSSDVLVIHDELDLPVGQVKFDFNRSSAGNNGVASLIERLGTKEFYRLRIGVGTGTGKRPPAQDKFVLGRFTPEEKEKLTEVKRQTFALLKEWLSTDN